MTTSRDHGEPELSPDEITVANLIDDIGRDAATLRFLLKERGSPISTQVQPVLDALDQQGLATPNAKGLYRLTEEGRARLRSGQDWVFEVVETFQVSFVDKPLLLGRLQRGTVRAKDWFDRPVELLATWRALSSSTAKTSPSTSSFFVSTEMGSPPETRWFEPNW